MELEQADANPTLEPNNVEHRQVGFMPIKFNEQNDTLWGLVDTGAQVSVISAGLANYLELYKEDMSNV